MTVYTIEHELRPGETLLWKGKPAAGLRLQPFDALLIPFSMVWGGGVFFVLFAAFNGGAFRAGPPMFYLIFALFIPLAIYITVGRFFVDAKIRADTVYGLTADRALIVSGLFSKTVQSLNLRAIPDITVKEKSNGSGSITFGASSNPFGAWMAVPGFPYTQSPSFQMITNVRKVSEMIHSAQSRKPD
jgi:hypothetical protein